MKKFLKKIPRVAYSFGTIVAAAAVNYSIVHSPIVFLYLCVLVAHELAHYFMAKMKGAKPKLPLFIPLPFLVIGLVSVVGLTDENIPSIAAAGPIAGVLTAILIMLVNFSVHIVSNFSAIIIVLSEALLNYFGSDGKKYRNAKKRLSCQLS